MMMGPDNQRATDVNLSVDKIVALKLPHGRDYSMMGSLKDESIIGSIEDNNGLYEPHVMNVINYVVKPNFVCMDIGANIGVLTLVIAHAAQQGKVFAIECSTKNYAYLLKNITQHKLMNCVPIQCGVSDRRQRVELNYVETRAGCSFVSPLGVEVGVSEDIELKTIDEILSGLEIEHVDFIKLDVEGGERRALLGAKNLFEKSQPILLIEFNPNPIERFYGEDPEALFTLLTELYPYIYLIHSSTGDLKLITSFNELMSIITEGKGWEDLLCTFRPMNLRIGLQHAFTPSSLHIGSSYMFNQPILDFANVCGLSGVESWGRWSGATLVEFRFRMDEMELAQHECGFINFEIRPFLYAKVKAQTMSISWGQGRHVEDRISKEGWISLPYSKVDWDGCESHEMTVTFNFPQAMSPCDVDPNSSDPRKLAIGFVTMSVTPKSKGKILGGKY